MIKNFSSNSKDWERTVGKTVRKSGMRIVGTVEEVVSEIPHGTQEQCFMVLDNGERINVNKIDEVTPNGVYLAVY